jgi:hypothetical protein
MKIRPASSDPATSRAGFNRPTPTDEDLHKLAAKVTAARQRLREARARRDQILNSTSWRLLAPVRFLIQRLRGRRAGSGAVNRAPVPLDRSPAPRADSRSASPTGAVLITDTALSSTTEPAAQAAAVTRPASPATDWNRRARSLLPGVPPDCLVDPEADEAGRTGVAFRLTDFSSAAEYLFGANAGPVTVTGAEPGEAVYLGWKPDPPLIAFLGSPELLHELAFDARVVLVRERAWRHDLVAGRFAFVLIETVWHVDRREWRYALVHDGPARPEAEALLTRCREIGVPVVVWFREEPDNYEHFSWLARHAQVVYAVDGHTVDRFRNDYPSTPARVLEPAIQPALHNPVRPVSLQKAQLKTKVLFDGWWELVEGAADDPLLAALRDRLRIVESEWDFGRLRLDDCQPFKTRTLGCITPADKAIMSRLFGAEVFLSPRVVADWRQRMMMLRSAACGSIVIHADTARTPIGLVEPQETGDPIHGAGLFDLLSDPLRRARIRHLNFRRIMNGHCIEHRLQAIADDLGTGATFVPPPPRIACLLVTMRPHLLPACVERFRSDRYPAKELVIVVHSSDFDLAGARRLIGDDPAIRIFKTSRRQSLGACLNFAFAQTDAPYWTKVDDDDIYGVNYLSDVMLYPRAVNAAVFGKPTSFVYFEDSDQVHWLPEWAQHELHLRRFGEPGYVVVGATIGGRRDVLENIGFSERRRRGADSEFVKRCQASGCDFLLTDCFNMAVFRSSRAGFHTWSLNQDRLRKKTGRVMPFEEGRSVIFI